MNLGQIRDLSLKLINSYSADGITLPLADTSDFRLACTDFINTAYYKSLQYDPVESVFSITQNHIPNLLSDDFNLKQHLSDDISLSAVGVRSYYFEVDHPATVYFEENINGVWVNLTTLTITGISSFTEYKGLLLSSSITNAVRIRFSGDFPYNFRRVALYGYSFALANDVPRFQPYVRYPLPSDYISLNKIIQSSDDRLHANMVDYFIENKNLVINYYYSGSFDVYYFCRPEALTLDTDVPRIAIQNQSYLAYFAAGNWLFSTGQQTQGIVLINMFDSFMNETKYNLDEPAGTIENSTGW